MPPCMYAGAEFRDGVFEGWKHTDADYGRRHSLMAVKQDVKLLNENIVLYTVEKPLSQIAAKHGIRAEEIDWFLPHYSSGFFRDRLSDGLKTSASTFRRKNGLPICTARATRVRPRFTSSLKNLCVLSPSNTAKKSCVTFRKAAVFQHVSCFWKQ